MHLFRSFEGVAAKAPRDDKDGGGENRRPRRGVRTLLLARHWPLMIAALLATSVPGQGPEPLLWPLPIQEGLTSGFGESRGNHLHAGVDFRTHQEEGWPVYAVADGAVERVRREPHGYGRVLYLKLQDGRTAVYGHLVRFEEERLGIEERLRQQCAREKTSFPGDIWFQPPIPVRAGDVVAFSGEMGVGFPHLHLEIRKEAEVQDPFVEGLPLPQPMQAPRMLGLRFVPRDASARAEGSVLPVLVKAEPDPNGGFALGGPVSISGRVDVQLSFRDHLGINEKPVAPAEVEASLDGKVVFRMNLTRFDFQQTFEGPWLWEPGAASPLPVLLLRRASGLTLPGVEGEGLPVLSDDRVHTLSVTARNRAGLASTLTAVLQADPSPPLPRRLALPGHGYRLREYRILDSGLLLELERQSPEGVTPLLVGGRPTGEIVVEEAGATLVRALLPPESLPREGGRLALGSDRLPVWAAAGPGSISTGALEIRLPEGAIGTASQEGFPKPAGEVGGSAALFRAGPFPLQEKVSIACKPSGSSKGLGLYSGGGSRYLGAVPGNPQPFRGDGVYLLRRDHQSPEWKKPRLARIPHLETLEIRIPVRDAGTGVSPQTLRVHLDGKPVYPDWDGDRGEVRIDARDVGPGTHHLTGKVTDRAGNPSSLHRAKVRIPE